MVSGIETGVRDPTHLEDPMPSHRRRTAAVLFVLVAAFALAGCGDSGNKSTNPPVGGGDQFDSGHISQNATFEHTFATQDTVAYHCSIHSFMTGVVLVADTTAAGDKTVDITGSQFTPAIISVHTGNKVTWTNHDGFDHTVTRS